MEILLSLLRTLVFIVATVAATVYVSRRMGRGRPLLWTGTTLLVLNWLTLFGFTTYQAGSSGGSPDVAVWINWCGYLLPFFAALAYIWGVGQAATSSRTPSAAAVPPVAARAGAGAGTAGEAPASSPPGTSGDGTDRSPGPASAGSAGSSGLPAGPSAAGPSGSAGSGSGAAGSGSGAAGSGSGVAGSPSRGASGSSGPDR